MPVRNVEAPLAEALGSLEDQTYRDHEVLLFDDGSEDHTLDIIAKAARRDRRIRLVGSERVGLVAALKRAIAASNAPLLARMDGDDISHPERVEKQVALLDRTERTAAVSCLVRHVPEERVRGGMARYEAWLNSLVTPEAIERDLFVESPLCHPSVMMRREAYDSVEGYLDDGLPEDYGLWLQLAEAGFSFAKVDELLFYWREGDRRFSRTDPRYRPERFLTLKLRHLARMYLGETARVAIWGAGKVGRQLSRALGRIAIEVTSFIDIDPNKIGHRVHCVPVIPPPARLSDTGADKVLVAVGSGRARAGIRSYLTGIGFEELRDFVCVA